MDPVAARQEWLKLGVMVNDPAQLGRLASLRIEPPVRIASARPIRRFEIGAFSYLNGGEFNVSTLGRYCSVAQGVIVLPADHPVDWLSTHPFQYSALGFLPSAPEFAFAQELRGFLPSGAASPVTPTTIGHDVWIGHGAMILSGVTIGDGAVIGAGTVVTRDVPPYAIVVGNPGRVIRHRFDEALIARLQEAQWWRYAPWHLKGLDFRCPEGALDELDRRAAAGEIAPYRCDVIGEERAREIVGPG